MSRRITLIRKSCMLFFALMMLQFSASALTYTAVASGNFSSSATWSGGNVPPQTVLLDQITIGSGITVTLDQTVRINGLLSSLNVEGSLVSANNSALILTTGTLAGNGNIDVDSLALGLATGFNFTGTITADDFSSTVAGSTTAADITVVNQLWLGGSLDLLANGSLTLGNNSNIIISGGVFTNTAGSLNLTGNYNVIYNGASSTSGLELTGTGLQSVTIDLSTAVSSVTLNTDLVLNGMLTLTTGNLVLAGNDLIIGANGDISSSNNGFIVSTSSSNIAINATGGTAGSLNFGGTGNTINNFTINLGSGAGAQTGITGALTVMGVLDLNSGTLNFSNTTLNIGGTFTGTGTLYGNTNSNLNIIAAAGLSTDLVFATGGQNLNDLNIGSASGTSVSLGSVLVIDGDLTLATGTQFDITDQQLTINGTLAGTGTFTTNISSGLILNTSFNTVLNLTGINGSVGTLGFNGATAITTLTLTGDLTIATSLSLQNGTFVLDGNDLTINGNIVAGGLGTVNSSSSSSVSVVTTSALAGGLMFSSNANTVDDFTVNVGSGNSLDINTDLNITGQLLLQGGTVNIGNNDLSVALGGSVSGGSADNYVVTSGGGSLNIALTANTSATFDVGTSTNYAPAQVDLNNGSASGSVGVSVQNDVLAQGTAGVDLSGTQSMVDATWYVTSDITTDLDLDLEVMWSADMEVNSFNRAAAHISHYVNSNWDMAANAAATTEANSMFSIRREGFTSLSPFAVFDENTVTGITETAKSVEFRMFPNPSSTNMIINCAEANNENLTVDIMSIQGSVIKTYNITSDNYSIPVSELANGSYIARVYNANMNGVQKFTKM